MGQAMQDTSFFARPDSFPRRHLSPLTVEHETDKPNLGP